MTLKERIKLIKFKFIAHKHFITAKGDCYINYIINKYINCTKPDDYIESYEKAIGLREEQVMEIKQFEIFYKNEDGSINEGMVHFLAANMALAMLLISLKEEQVQKYLNLITNPQAKKVIDAMAHPDKQLREV